jgi:hypothetical protein
MKQSIMSIGLILFLVFVISVGQLAAEDGWKAGVARTIITPGDPIWLAGYGGRTEPSQGVLHDIWVKALALEDALGHQAVLVTSDLLGLPKRMSDVIRYQLEKELGLKKEQVLLNSSHTHTGPVLQDALYDIYPLNAEELHKIEIYSDELVKKIIGLVHQAFAKLEPVEIYSGNGTARFQVNRRNNNESALAGQSELSGPNDHAVPVLKITKSGGELLAIAFGYACHPTVLGINQWSGDYPGFAQLELENEHPGAMALFFQGAGGDQNPLPRRTIPLARQYGRTLAAAVDRVIEEDMQRLQPTLSTAYTEIELNLEAPPTLLELTKDYDAYSGYQKRWAGRMKEKAERGETFQETYPYPLQVWKLGNQPVLALGGELLVGYAIQLKKIFGNNIFVLGYSNDVMGYIPTDKVLLEGGYEGKTSQMVYGLPAKWEPGIEDKILSGIEELAKSAGVPYSKKQD